MTSFRYCDFFAGVGLVDLGLQKPDWECVWANDIDSRKGQIYEANFGPHTLELGDIAEIEPESLPQDIDMAWASFPCQDLSLAGWRRGMSAERSGTFWAFWRIMRDLHDKGQRPPIIAIENVTGMLYGDNFMGLCEALTALGMQFGPLVVDARWFLPQSRPRVFVVAVDANVDCRDLEDPWPLGSPWFPTPVWTAWQALPPSLKTLWRWWKLPIPPENTCSVDDIIEIDPMQVDWHTREETDRLLGMMTPRNLDKVKRAMEQGGRLVGFLYKRTRNGKQRAEVRFDGIAGCLRTPQGGSSRQTVLIVENGSAKSRLLSPREAARLMGVPDSFQLSAKYNDAYRAMGDGVAVPVVAWLSKHLLSPLARTASQSSDLTHRPFDPTSNDHVTAYRNTTNTRATLWSLSGRSAREVG